MPYQPAKHLAPDTGSKLLAFVVGLQAEARLTGGSTFIGGGTAEGAAQAARQAIAANAKALVSFGLAGGLSPAFEPGTLLSPKTIITQTRRYHTDPQLSRALGGTPCPAAFAATRIAVSAQDKAALRAETQADIVDLESGAVAEAATQAGLPFAVLRAVCDPATRTLPPAALLALTDTGAIALLRVAVSIIRHPAQIPPLIALAADAAAARRALNTHMVSLNASFALRDWQ